VTHDVAITFVGAAGTVTGSKYLVDLAGTRLLVDCGLFQGLKRLRERNWRPLPFDIASIDAVVLTHAHLDHSGYLPLLVKQGFKGPVYCTEGTRALCGILLPDSGHLQEEDARYANRKGFSKHRPALPLYTQEDAERSLARLRPVATDQSMAVTADVAVRFRPVGHILGAASVELAIGDERLVFSGDVGRPDDPVMRPPRPLSRADHLVVESTYGDRRHPETDPAEALARIVSATIERDGVVLIPSFAVGRAQTLLHLIDRLRRDGRVPLDVPVFLNSPMAINATEIFCAHQDEHRLTSEQCRAMCNVATYVNSVEESKALNERRGPMIIISASGMATGGRILHHLKAFAGEPRNTILFAGYQAAGTRGEALLQGAKEIKIHGQQHRVRAEVTQISGLSAHADYQELIEWLRPVSAPARTFITHGEPRASAALQAHLEKALGWRSETPGDGDAIRIGASP
jgi:metallo-beta-lactamase family protein